jgi:hypothetical protein
MHHLPHCRLPGLCRGAEEGEGRCIWYDACGWDPAYEDGVGDNYVHFLNCRQGRQTFQYGHDI